MNPLINIDVKGENHIIVSARHLLMVAENYMSMFSEGTLKPFSTHKRLIQLLAEQNNFKGKEYRNEVYRWLTDNTSLSVYEYEIKITPKGFFRSDIDKGDIDILAINKKKKIIYSIECKNTSQSKVPYDFKNEMDTYLGKDGKEGLIIKHVNRHEWLLQNKKSVIEKIGVDDTYKIKSLVISKNILPLTYIRKSSIPLISFYELMTGKIVL